MGPVCSGCGQGGHLLALPRAATRHGGRGQGSMQQSTWPGAWCQGEGRRRQPLNVVHIAHILLNVWTSLCAGQQGTASHASWLRYGFETDFGRFFFWACSLFFLALIPGWDLPSALPASRWPLGGKTHVHVQTCGLARRIFFCGCVPRSGAILLSVLGDVVGVVGASLVTEDGCSWAGCNRA